MAMLGGGAAAAVLVGAAIYATRGSKATPAPVPVPAVSVKVEPRPKPLEVAPSPIATVTFEVNSTPPGATVAIDGKTVGVTPLMLPQQAGDDGNAKVQLAFSLEGYQSVTASAEGHGMVQVNQVLQKKKGKKKPAQQRDPGFKDDPYQ
jgi:hypothetical protein